MRDDALTARLIDKATCVADFIKASGVTPRSKAGHMTAPSSIGTSSEKALACGAVPHMSRCKGAPIGALCMSPSQTRWPGFTPPRWPESDRR